LGISLIVGAWLTLLAVLPAAASLRLAWWRESPPELVSALKLMAATELVYALLLALAMLL
jgi:1,4-dihydroxy-2-naphthoate octaprenyltransferase